MRPRLDKPGVFRNPPARMPLRPTASDLLIIRQGELPWLTTLPPGWAASLTGTVCCLV